MILYLDDELGPNMDDFLLLELKELGLPVRPFRSVDTAWEFLSKKSKPLDVAIIDVMMPPGKLFDLESTRQGLTTGLHFYNKVREISDCPVYFITNVTAEIVQNAADDDSNAYFRVKTDHFYDELADEIEAAYLEARVGPNRRRRSLDGSESAATLARDSAFCRQRTGIGAARSRQQHSGRDGRWICCRRS